MNDRQQFERNKKVFHLKTTYQERLETLANQLLDFLFIPYKDEEGSQIIIVDRNRLKHFGINEGEPINFGDLSATCTLENGVYKIIIEEAAPDSCPTLCGYIETYLTAWGYDNFTIETEW